MKLFTVPAAALALFLAAVFSCSAAEKPNVLFIAVDDLKPLLGCYGDKTIKSPNLDRLAARGLLFERAYANQAVCAPSRNALMTGRRPQALGIYDLGTNFRLAAPDTVTLAQYFKQHGWHAEGMGKIFHVGHGNHDDAASWSVPLFSEKSIAYVSPEKRDGGTTREEALFANTSGDKVATMPRGAPVEAADVLDEAYPDGRIATEAVRRLRAAREKSGEPFFLAVGFLKPHLPFCAPKKYWDMYDRAAFALPARTTPPDGAPKFAPTTFGELRQYRDIPETGPVSDAQARELIHGYHAAVSYMDAQLGRVLDALDENGLTDKTIIVLWGDHGWHLGDHGMWCKHTNYEEAARIPLIIVAPGVTRPGTRTAALVESVDLFPTLAELARLSAAQVPQGLDGRSIVPILRDPAASVQAHIFHVYPRGEKLGRAVRTARHRLVEWKNPGAPADTAVLELYDYETDPGETKNLAAEQPEVVARLRAILAKEPEAKAQFSNARQDRAGMFAKRDRDGDGQLTREEFLANQPDPDKAPARFTAFDVDRDGMLSRDEFISMGKSEVKSIEIWKVSAPPPALNVPAFYKKYLSADGYPIVASEKVNDYALKEAAYLINLMLAKRPDVRAAMIANGSRMCIIGYNEFTTDLPGWEHMTPKDFWDARARGMGGSETDPLCSSAEENLLAYPGDPYSTENILIHEFAHNIHLRGMVRVDPTFDGRVKAAYDAAMTAGLWKGKYASVNHHEYFAEGVQSWFDNNRENDHDHNHVNTRVELVEYDPALAALCREVFGDTELKYTKPATRLRDHLAGYDPATAPTFTWPERLVKTRDEIRQKAQERSRAAEATAAPAGK